MYTRLCLDKNKRNVHINIMCISLSVAPMIEMPPEGSLEEVLETNETEFECIATGFPPPTITFSMGSLLLVREGSESDTGFIQDRVNLLQPESTPVGDGTYRVTRRLMVFNAMDGDSGTYTCNASSTIPALNPMEYLDSRNFDLLVLGTYEHIACHCSVCILFCICVPMYGRRLELVTECNLAEPVSSDKYKVQLSLSIPSPCPPQLLPPFQYFP